MRIFRLYMHWLLFTLISTSFLLISRHSLALSYHAQCLANKGSLLVSIYSAENKIYFRYMNQAGTDSFPLFEGVVTKQTLPFLKIARQDLASIDKELLLSWPLEKCTFSLTNSFLMECNAGATFIVPMDSKLESYSFSTSLIKETSLASSYDVFKIRLGIEGKDFHHSIAMPLDPTHCQAQYLP